KTDSLLVFGLNPQQHAPTDAESKPFFQAIVERVRHLPGVQSATAMRHRIGGGWSSNTSVLLDGQKPKTPDGSFAGGRWNAVGSDFLKTLGVPLLAGRDFSDAASPASAPAMIVNETFAKRYLNGSPAIGHQVQLGGRNNMLFTIIGVAAHFKYPPLRQTPPPLPYLPFP